MVAVARAPEALDELAARYDGLTVIRGDVLDPASLAMPAADADAVLSAPGIGYRRHATTVYSRGTANVITAMLDAGVRRLVCTSTTSLVVPPARRSPSAWCSATCCSGCCASPARTSR